MNYLLKKISLRHSLAVFLFVLVLSLPDQAFAVQRTWTGGFIIATWHSASNWNPNGIPTTSDSVIIPGGADAIPFISSAAVCEHLVIKTGGILTMFGSGTLDVGKNISIGDSTGTPSDGTLIMFGAATLRIGGNYYKRDSATLTQGTSTIVFNGSGEQLCWSGGVATDDDFYNITINKSSGNVILGEPILVSGSMTISNGTLETDGNDISVVQNWSNSGTFTADSNVVSFTGTTGGPFTITGGSSAFYDFTVSGAVTYQLGSNLDINGDLTISGDSLDGNDYNITVAENWRSTGTFAARQGTVTLDGSDVQTLSNATGTFNNLTINNTAGISLSSNIVVGNTLTMTNGNITTGSDTLSLGTNTASRGTLSRTSGTIVGNFRRWFAASTVSDITFAIGTSDYYRPVDLSFTVAPTLGGTLTAFFTEADPGSAGLPLDDSDVNILNVSPDGYWTLASADGLSGGTYDLDLTATAFIGVGNPATLRILKRRNGGASWTLDGSHVTGIGTIAVPVARRSGLSGFSEFGIGGSSDNSLPVTLTSFKVVVLQGQIVLNWVTESEIDNSHWLIERKLLSPEEYHKVISGSLNLLHTSNPFTVIARIEGRGTTNSRTEYQYVDQSAQTNVIYAYRLADISFSGNKTYHAAAFIVPGNNPGNFELHQNHPNPFNPWTHIRFNVPLESMISIKIYDLLGQEIIELASGNKLPGFYEIIWDGKNQNHRSVASGMYIYQIVAEAVDGSLRFVQSKKMLLVY